jgi:glycosyltransferase involved in cell wall biosynthesis
MAAQYCCKFYKEKSETDKIMTQPLLSVLMTAYNRQDYIAEAIESVLASTYSNFELIIVDDRSKDNTVEIAREYAARDSRIKVYINEQNLGDYANRNKAASYASGKYLKYLDSDDFIYPHGLEVMVRSMEKFPEAGLGLPYKRDLESVPYPILVDPESAYKAYFFNGDFMTTGPTSAIIKRSLFEEVGGFSGKRFIGDIEMWLVLAAKQPVVKFQPALFWWRQHESQEYKMGQVPDGYFTLNFVTLIDLLHNAQCPLTESDTQRAIAKLDKWQSRFILHLLIKKRAFKHAFRVMKNCSLTPAAVLQKAFS